MTTLKRLYRSRKGGASVAIAVIMAMIVASYFIQNIMVWGGTMSSVDRDRLNEKIEITKISFRSGPVLAVQVQNTGTVIAHIVRLYLEPATSNPIIKQISSAEKLPSYLDVQELDTIETSDLTDDYNDESDDFVVTVVTERGNFASKTHQFEPILPDINQVGQWGVFKINWFYSKYSSSMSPPSPLAVPKADGSDPILSDAILIYQNDKYVAFYVKVVNDFGEEATIKSQSLLTLTSLKKSSGQVLANFFIVKALDYTPVAPTITPYNNDYTVQPGDTQTLIFAASAASVNTWLWGSTTKIFGTETVTQGSGIQISLFYELGGVAYGQTISTQAVIFQGTG